MVKKFSRFNHILIPFVFIILLVFLYGLFNKFNWLQNYYIKDILYVLAVLIITWFISRLILVFATTLFGISRKEKTPHIVKAILDIILFTVGFVIILQYFKIAITPIIATLGIGGIALGFALQDTLTNFFAGLSILSERQISVGDYVNVDGNIGTIEDLGWRSSKLKTFYGYEVIIPNSKFAETQVIKYLNHNKGFVFDISLGVSYESNLEKVEKVVLEEAKTIQSKFDIVFKPYIYYTEFGDSNILFKIFFKTNNYADKYKLTHEFIKKIKTRFNKEKIDISWPVRKIYMNK